MQFNRSFSTQQSTATKTTRSWSHMSLGTLLVLLIMCSVVGCSLFTDSNAASRSTVNDYCQAIEQNDYNKAFSYIDTSGQAVTETTFAQTEQTLQQSGVRIVSHTIKDINVTDTTAAVTVEITKASSLLGQENKTTGTVTLQLKQVDGDWKIVYNNTAALLV